MTYILQADCERQLTAARIQITALAAQVQADAEARRALMATIRAAIEHSENSDWYEGGNDERRAYRHVLELLGETL